LIIDHWSFDIGLRSFLLEADGKLSEKRGIRGELDVRMRERRGSLKRKKKKLMIGKES
jgi:hypothetical protein